MLVPVVLFVLWLVAVSFGTPLRETSHRAHRSSIRRSHPTFKLDRQAALAARVATQRKYHNAPALLAGLGTSPGYAISASLRNTYDRASDYATNIALLSSPLNSSLDQPFYSRPAVSVAATGALQNGTIEPLQADTDGIRDLEYYGEIVLGSPPQLFMIDYDTGSADLWIPVDCNNCGVLKSFQANASITFQDLGQPFSVVYGSGSVSGTLAQDTVSVGPLTAHNQAFGAVHSVSQNFATSPNDGLAGLAFGTIANSHRPTFFESAMSQLPAPLFSVYLTRTQTYGSEIYFGGIDASKTRETDVHWVPVVSKTYWTVDLAAVSVNGARVEAGKVHAIVDTGTSFIYLPSRVARAVHKLIPDAEPAPDYGAGFWTYPCAARVEVSFVLGPETLALDTRDLNLGRHEGDPTNSSCISALVDGGSAFRFAILGDSFLKSYVSIYDYSHDGRVGFMKSINE